MTLVWDLLCRDFGSITVLLHAPVDPNHLTRRRITPSKWMGGWAALASPAPSKLYLEEKQLGRNLILI